ncbi:MAG: hypothetical protein WBE83_04465 [Candidatus Cybelea sp.]|jgi:hypothetical protein
MPDAESSEPPPIRLDCERTKMSILGFSRCALTSCVAATLLAGCGGAQPPGAMPQSNAPQERPAAGRNSSHGPANGDQLWADGCVSRPFTGICTFSYPAGKYLGWLEDYSGGAPYNMCADRLGHVFVISGDGSGFSVLVYDQDGRGPRVLRDRPNTWPSGCAVDPKTEDLAVANTAQEKRSGNVVIFSHARGTPKTYRAPNLFDYAFCGYDDAGNLYVDGTNKSGAFELDERAVGSEHFGSIALDRTIRKAGPIQWDGHHLAVGYGDKYGAAVLRVDITGSEGNVMGVTRLRGPGQAHTRLGPFWIAGRTIIASYGDVHGNPIGFWKYPEGGEPFRIIRHGSNEVSQRAVTVSVAAR